MSQEENQFPKPAKELFEVLNRLEHELVLRDKLETNDANELDQEKM